MNNLNEHIVDKIQNVDKAIASNIELIDRTRRGLVSTNVLSQLRNLVEHVLVYGYGLKNHIKVELDWNHLNKIEEKMRIYSEYEFILKFHRLLQMSESHYTQTEEDSERLMLSYYEYLMRLKKFVKDKIGINILNNIGDFPLNLDKTNKEYYSRIISRIKTFDYTYPTNSQRLYVQKKKTIIIGDDIIYEVVLTPAIDNVSKFDRVVAYSRLDIKTSYPINATIYETEINEFGRFIPISIIDSYACSIRPCELKNYSKLLGYKSDFKSSSNDYKNMMYYLSSTTYNLLSLVKSEADYFYSVVNGFQNSLPGKSFVKALEKSRDIIINKKAGCNILAYLLYTMKNLVLKDQYAFDTNPSLSDLYVDWGCIPFDKMPLTTSLKNHNPMSMDLFECFDIEGRKHELLSRCLLKNAEVNKKIYTDIKDLPFDDFDKLISEFNRNVYYKHTHRKIEKYSHYLYIKGYEDNIHEIINLLKQNTESGISGYSSMANQWVDRQNDIDDENKKEIIKNLFVSSHAALVYGAAGTGKTTLLKYISELFENNSKLFVANTNPTVELLKRRIKDSKSDFMTVAKIISGSYKTDILIIDECSTISNSDMITLLKRTDFQAILLVGDTYQIESIQFGNWFAIIKYFINENVVFELTNAFRTKSESLLDFWNCIRDFNIDEALTKMIVYGYNSAIDESIFILGDRDEIVLCLNYDGIYGVNNLNRMLQSSNNNKAIKIGINSYKTNDPILFNDSNRFSPIIFNNNKGIITNIIDKENEVYFEIKLDKLITEFDVMDISGLTYIGNNEEDTCSIVGFYVDKNIDSDEDVHQERVLPFQIAYAISIHKAQGLEYNSVKIVVSSEIEEQVTHNIFYTAITRAKEKLKIYWSPEVMEEVFSGFAKDKSKKDAHILAGKYNMKIHK